MATEIKIEVDGRNNLEMVPTSEYAEVRCTTDGSDVEETLFNSPAKRHARSITWQNVNFTVKGKIKILTDCWGKVKGGQVCAIMGPSGSGKTSLLNVLAGRSASAPGIVVEGKIKVGPHYINPVAFRKNIAYMMQEDSLMATATPREALRFSANLRLPSTLTSKEIDEKVERLLSALGLQDCADVIIGGALIKGISGGERKRTSVGVELITDPTLLFLDEATTGLDSYSATNLVKLLKVIAHNCAILCTIHQPSSEVFFLFDLVIFMKDGRIFYQGPTKNITSFYVSRGRICPENYNPSDFFMSLCLSETVEALTKQQLFVEAPADLAMDDIQSLKLDKDVLVFHTESSFIKQVLAISYREGVHFLRNTHSLIARFGLTIVLNLLFGLMFLNAGSRDNADPDNFNTHVGAMSMLVTFSMMGAAQQVLLGFPFERPMILREYVTGTYSIFAYFLSKMVMEVPATFCQMLLQYIIAYFMIGLQGNFIFLVLTAFALGMVSSSVAMGLGCLVPDVKDVTELAPLAYIPQLLFAGFFIRTSQIPVFLRWAQYLCGMKYAMNLTLMTEFQTSRSDCNHSPAALRNCQSILDLNDVKPKIFYVSIILLVGIFAAFRLLGAGILYQKAKRFY